MPLNDNERYEKMSSSVPKGTGPEYTQEGYPLAENSWMFLLSAGPIGSVPNKILHPGPWLPEIPAALHLQLLVVYGQMGMVRILLEGEGIY